MFQYLWIVIFAVLWIVWTIRAGRSLIRYCKRVGDPIEFVIWLVCNTLILSGASFLEFVANHNIGG